MHKNAPHRWILRFKQPLLGGLLGGAFRLAPVLLNWLDRKNEPWHWLVMQDQVLEFAKMRGAAAGRNCYGNLTILVFRIHTMR